MKKILIILVILSAFFCNTAIASNTIEPKNLQKLLLSQDTLKRLADTILNGDQEVQRQMACYGFIKKLVRALKVPQSYLFPFDSLKNLSKVHAPDDKFRIFTFYLQRTNGTYRYFGLIQFHNESKLEMIPFFDYSPLIRNVEDTVCNAKSWYGCLYYNIVQKEIKGKQYYFLMGWKGKNTREVEKILEVFTLENNEPVLGAPVFYKNQNKRQTIQKRYVIAYNKSASVTFNYDDNSNQIIFDHLINKNEAKNNITVDIKPRAYDMVPDGSYEAFKWVLDHWEWVPYLENSGYNEAPRPVPVFEK